MYAPPTDLDERQLVEMLRASWSIDVSKTSYEPVGFGTHHYIARDRRDARWFVNVDDLTRDAVAPETALDVLARAFGTAAALRDVGLEFVHSPVPGADGFVVRLDDRYGVSVVPYLEGTSNEFGEFASDDERREVLRVLGRMHAAMPVVPADLQRRETFAVPLRRQLLEALENLDAPWTGGPFSEPARRLLSASATSVRQSFERYDELVSAVPAGDWVVTHGEPHAANVMHATDGSLVLIDWDTAAIAPRERDLWMAEPRTNEDWSAYASSGGSSSLNGATIDMYRRNWDLTEIANYTDTFRRPHVEDANTRLGWKGLEQYLSAIR